jgi:hypothetical protein
VGDGGVRNRRWLVAGAAIGIGSGIVAFLGTLMCFPSGRQAVGLLLKGALGISDVFH